ncbi:MAG TPA: M28 family peptidase, partial [Terriglobales bacterium]|nr:M28 family peptidase [Terriglobales bacterium]
MKLTSIAVLLTSLSLTAAAAERHLVPQQTFDAIARELSGEQAQENTRRIVEYHRIQGSPMMADVAEQVVLPSLQAAGFSLTDERAAVFAKKEQFPSDGKTKYGTFLSPAGWEMRSGELWVTAAGADKEFKPYPVCRYADVPMCVSSYSKGGTWEGELVEVGAGTKDADYKDKDVRGKVALAYGYAANVVREAVLKHGAVGVVIYPPPGDRAEHPDMTRYNGIWPRAEEFEATRGGFQISQTAYTRIQGLMRAGPVRVKGTIDASYVPGKLTLVHAWIRGTENPEQEVILVGHLDHPKWSANDNASGSGALLEIARTYAALIKAGKLPSPKKTLHFMWVPEFFGTMAYVANHPETRRCGAWDDPRSAVKPWKEKDPCVVAALNLDMVGEDTVKTNSRFYFTRTPDSVPSFLNALMADALAQTRAANLSAPTGTRNLWVPEEIGLALGSDHEVFLGLGIPATMLGHDPDWTHHTSEDKMDKTDASEFKRVGTFAAVGAWWMGNNDGHAASDFEKTAEASLRLNRLNELLSRRTESAALRRATALNLRAAGDFTRSLLTRAGYYAEGKDGGIFPGTGGGVTHPPGPRRLVLAPLDASALENVSEADKKWVAEQRARFAVEAEGITDQ